MDNADYFLRGGVDNHHRGDFLLFHEIEGFTGEKLRADGLGSAHHTIAGGHRECGAAVFFHEAAEIAIGEDTGEFSIGGEDGGHAQFLGGHFMKCGRHGRIGRNTRHGVAGMHEVLDTEKFLAEASRGMECGKIVGFKAPAFEQGNGEGIAQGHGDGGAGGGSEVERTSFFFDADIENNIAGNGESGLRIAGESDDGNFEALQCFE